MTYRDLIVERNGPLAKVILNPPELLNTLSLRLLRELKDAAWEIQKDSEIRTVILLTEKVSAEEFLRWGLITPLKRPRKTNRI